MGDSARINTATIFETIIKGDSLKQPDYRAIYCDATGTAVVTDKKGTETTFNLVSGQILPIQPVLIKTTSTATLIGLN